MPRTTAMSASTRALPGARELLDYLSDNEIPWAIATSGRMETAGPVLSILGVDPDQDVVITRDMVGYAKPDPDLFMAAAEKLGIDIATPAWWATRSGICWQLSGRTPLALGFNRAVMALTNLNGPVLTGCLRIRRTC